jgi:hypothetical protein
VLAWTPIACELINWPENGISVLKEFYSRFHVGSGWGPWSNRFVQRRPLLEALTDHANPSIRAWANDALGKLDTHIAQLNEEEQIRDERFE